jgi:hypothetical protein
MIELLHKLNFELFLSLGFFIQRVRLNAASLFLPRRRQNPAVFRRLLKLANPMKHASVVTAGWHPKLKVPACGGLRFTVLRGANAARW